MHRHLDSRDFLTSFTEPQLLEWSNGTAPYYIAILPGSTTDEDPVSRLSSVFA